jgi:transcriptional regulator with XRE-family HTH domain
VPSVLSDVNSSVHVGQHLRQWRRLRELTQEQAAVAAGLSRGWLAGIERERFPNPTLANLLALMQVYDLGSLDELLGPLPSYRIAQQWQAAGWTGTRRESS